VSVPVTAKCRSSANLGTELSIQIAQAREGLGVASSYGSVELRCDGVDRQYTVRAAATSGSFARGSAWLWAYAGSDCYFDYDEEGMVCRSTHRISKEVRLRP
jgi:hypothetical protein